MNLGLTLGFRFFLVFLEEADDRRSRADACERGPYEPNDPGLELTIVEVYFAFLRSFGLCADNVKEPSLEFLGC